MASSFNSDPTASRRRRRIIAAAVVGAVLALLAIFVVNNVYDPFADEVPDLRVFLPDDLDFVVVCEDLPAFLEGLEESDFFDSLDRDPGFQAFLSSPRGQAAGAITQLRNLLAEIHRVESGIELPIDVPFLGGLSGRQVVIGGYASDAAGADRPAIPPLIAAIQPESAWGQVAANVLGSETLSGWFVEGRAPLEAIDHYNWGTKLTIVHQGQRIELGLARVEGAVLLGTDIDVLVRIIKRVRAEGIPFAPPERYTDRWPWERATNDVTLRLSFSRRQAERDLGVRQRFLEPLWGPEMASTFEELFPELDSRGADTISIEIDREARVRWESDVIARRPASLFASTTPVEGAALHRQLQQLVHNLPDDLFGYAWLQAPPGALIRRVLEDPRLVDRDKRALWFEELAANIPEFRVAAPAPGLPPDLTETIAGKLDAFFHPGVSVMLFKKERNDDAVDSAPGVAVAFRVRDTVELARFIEEVDAALARADVRAFDRIEEGGDVYWRITNSSFLDDPINTRPGFARLGEWFVVTNWFRFLEGVPRVVRGEDVGFDSEAAAALDRRVQELDLDTRGLLYLNAERFYRFMDVAKEGWIEDRAEISEQEKGMEIQRLEREGRAAGVLPSDLDAWVDRRFQKWKIGLRRTRNPDMIRQEVDRNLDYFREAFRHFFASIGRAEERLRLDLRLVAR